MSLLATTSLASAACGTGDGGPGHLDEPPEPVAGHEAALTQPWRSADLGGVALQLDPSVVGSDTSKRAFYVGPNSHLFLSSFDGGPWWSAPADLGGVQLTSSPSAIVVGANRYRVFYRGPNGHLFMSSFDGGPWWSAPADLGGVQLTSAPSAVVVGTNKFRVFYRGPNGHLFMSSFDGGPWWSAPADLGGVVFTGAPAAVVPQAEPQSIRVFYRGAGDHLLMSSYDGGPWWSGVADLGAVGMSTSPTAVSSLPHRLDVFYGDASGRLAHSQWDGGPWWSEVFFHDLPLGSAPSARSAWEVFYRAPDTGHLTLATPGAQTAAEVTDPGDTRWLLGTALQNLFNWCLPDLLVRYHGDPARPSDLLLFARDPDALAGVLAGMGDGDIRNGRWTENVSAPQGTPRAIDLPYPAHADTPWSPTTQALSTAQFWGSSSLPANNDSMCVHPWSPRQWSYLGAVKAAATVQHGACASGLELDESVLAPVAQQVFDGLAQGTGTYNVRTIYSHLASIFRRDPAGSAAVLPGFLMAFHYSFDLAGVGNEIWATWEFLFGLADGELTVSAHEHHQDYSGVWGPVASGKMRNGLNALPERLRASSRDRQEILDPHWSFLQCQVATDCEGAADLVAAGIATSTNLARLGLPNPSADDLNHLKCAVGSPSACAALGRAPDLAAHWSCREDEKCRFRLPIKRLNPGPEHLELVWFDGVELDNPAFAFAAAGGEGQMCTLHPTQLAHGVESFPRGFARVDFGP
jgi:hypothetical protein